MACLTRCTQLLALKQPSMQKNSLCMFQAQPGGWVGDFAAAEPQRCCGALCAGTCGLSHPHCTPGLWLSASKDISWPRGWWCRAWLSLSSHVSCPPCIIGCSYLGEDYSCSMSELPQDSFHLTPSFFRPTSLHVLLALPVIHQCSWSYILCKLHLRMVASVGMMYHSFLVDITFLHFLPMHHSFRVCTACQCAIVLFCQQVRRVMQQPG